MTASSVLCRSRGADHDQDDPAWLYSVQVGHSTPEMTPDTQTLGATKRSELMMERWRERGTEACGHREEAELEI